ncbi:uncharacterized protein N7483_010981 [Penicillium malachiteum]|uniref:uncharacterized protein n=1 Tax=Penicillium malachiteum TaxID=1324776 RepID=UPI002548E38F|nr:uncharacterized protein N7483_010981 [Penicillium malachiteum]KAJ5713800.1 hypothetical protein N7483_010981 [Penicillium malachiteum]
MKASDSMPRSLNDGSSEAQPRNRNWKDTYKKITNLRRWGSKKNRSKHEDEESEPDEDSAMIIRATPHRPPSPYPEKSCAIGMTSWPSNIAKDPNRQGPDPWSRTEEEMFRSNIAFLASMRIIGYFNLFCLLIIKLPVSHLRDERFGFLWMGPRMFRRLRVFLLVTLYLQTPELVLDCLLDPIL